VPTGRAEDIVMDMQLPELLFVVGQLACALSLLYGAWLCLRHAGTAPAGSDARGHPQI